MFAKNEEGWEETEHADWQTVSGCLLNQLSAQHLFINLSSQKET